MNDLEQIKTVPRFFLAVSNFNHFSFVVIYVHVFII